MAGKDPARAVVNDSLFSTNHWSSIGEVPLRIPYTHGLNRQLQIGDVGPPTPQASQVESRQRLV